MDRFSAFLKEYALKTQFIVVTHRKGTMEAAEIMYGVTGEDAGVSRLVRKAGRSVKINFGGK